jgi:GalNAc-alpha-(1->4)-GalNAc-alpha-(1->3)-diNAcBac-PP-undecaprenol alpha-1,4-N-acetyl-D-galactosaminyltransferase
MRILLIISSLDVGGAERVLTTLANHFDDKGHNITIVTASANRASFTLNSNIELIKLDLSGSIRLIGALRGVIISSHPDVIISFMTEMNILALIVSKLQNIPLIVSERSAFDFLDIKPFWKKMRRVFYPSVDALVVLTDEDRDRYHFVKNRYKIENPLILRSRENSIKREKIILAVGRLNYVKGFDLLIKSFAKVNRDGWRLLIAGEGEERENLENLIDSLALSNRVELLGLVKDLEIYYKKSSIFVLSSRTEGFPAVLCEAMGYGLAVISFDCPSAPREIIRDKESGLLVKNGDIKELSREMEYLIDNPNIREKLSKNAKSIRERLSIDKIGDRWFKLIDEVIRR